MALIKGTEPPKALVAALQRLLRPLVGVLLANKIPFPYLSNLVKGVYVDVAKKHLQVTEGRFTDSRMSVLTGVHRKDIKRFRESPETTIETPKSLSIGARIIGLWVGHADYLDEKNQPRRLTRDQFDALVTAVSTDVRPRTILDEWLQQAVITQIDDEIELNAEALIPSESFDQLSHYFGHNLHDHIATAADNLLQHGPSQLERAVYYNQLTPQSIAELEAYAKAESVKLLRRVNKKALKQLEQDKRHPDAHHRFRFGVYFYQQDETKEEQ